MPKPQDETCRKIAALCRVRGIGENFAAVLTREVFYRSFDNRRQIASYVGITPMPYQSGGMGAHPNQDGLSATPYPSGVRAIAIEITEASFRCWR